MPEKKGVLKVVNNLRERESIAKGDSSHWEEFPMAKAGKTWIKK